MSVTRSGGRHQHPHLHLLGPVEASRDGRPIALGARKQRALLAMLALHPNETLSVDGLIDGLWGDDPPATAAKMVQLYVSQLRRLLDGDRGDDDALIVTHGRGYELRVGDETVDVAVFERLLSQAQASDAGSNARRRRGACTVARRAAGRRRRRAVRGC